MGILFKIQHKEPVILKVVRIVFFQDIQENHSLWNRFSTYSSFIEEINSLNTGTNDSFLNRNLHQV